MCVRMLSKFPDQETYMNYANVLNELANHVNVRSYVEQVSRPGDCVQSWIKLNSELPTPYHI